MPEGVKLKVAVVGGGAAGLLAAVIAGQEGAEVSILERNQRVGKKILTTGNGRCNLTNMDLHSSHYHGQNPKFAYSALQSFDNHRAIDFFERLGIAHKVEEEGKVFPFSNQASSVLDVLRYEVERLGIETITESEVKEIHKVSQGFELVLKEGKRHFAHRVILAAGGKAAPNLGSNGSGYALAEKLGHRVVEPFPALVQLKLESPFLKQIKGIKFDGEAEVLVKGKTLAKAQGEILFTEYGISGPPIFQLSRTAAEKLRMKNEVWLKVVLLPAWSRERLDQYLRKRWEDSPEKSVHFSFVGFINKQLVPVVLKQVGIEDINKPVSALTSREKEGILHLLQDWRFQVTGTNSWTAAQVTAGGVDVRDINPGTMESKLVPGLYFAGEILDIDGDCGGYNLQWAWSSGYVAGKNAAGG
ncbi:MULTISPECIES: NAD(P)/FAD-dependent oxidoreductase [Desulfitobacterium]|uniref:Flavoprotein, HI0933 family n=1 Tax=Desulfitobacterium dehalogenans (strain ATCC 51507 / DSM 9161 / JW/IU-DC1) TaxID=756499 RepID=I4ACK0_DESDJ|nr:MULTISPECIES: NAD(P)/FAD-dependent oxidoreductase [Desulfitobacterium]AFM01685.1 flavoprotein, HI0933 family [Desulfitobacterium dehalogenans ATCC 51507]